MNRIKRTLVAANIASLSVVGAGNALAAAKNVVLVHGAVMDGSGWRAVFDILTANGLNVRVVQEPLTGFENDVAAVKEMIEAMNGKVVLVGHSYGGAVITEAGGSPKVGALVYVAAQQPAEGETVGQLNARMPPAMDGKGASVSKEGYLTIAPKAFVRDIAGDLPQNTAVFLAASQRPTNVSAFSHVLASAAWRDKPSFAVVATQDRTINPELQRFMYARSKSHVIEIKGSHLVHMSQPSAVARVIMQAAEAAGE